MRVTIEVDGQKIEIAEYMIDDSSLSTPHHMEPAPCECRNGPCGYAHKRFTGKASLDLHLDLNESPRWT